MSDDAMGHILHNILNPSAEPGPPYTHTLSPLSPDPAEAVAWLRREIESDLGRARHMLDKRGAHPDPRREMHDAIADCEAKLAILDGHHILSRDHVGENYDEFSVVSIGGANKDHGCVTCHYYGMGGVKGHGICWTVRYLASAYRHREGYARFWGTPVTHTLTEDGQ